MPELNNETKKASGLLYIDQHDRVSVPLKKPKSMDTMTAEEAHDYLAPVYDSTFSSPMELAENETIFRLLRERGLYIGPVFDVGCGTGLYLEGAHEGEVPPSLYMGLDISGGMLSRARKKFPDYSFYKADMADRDYPNPSRYYSVVSLFGSMSYTPQPMEAMRNMVDHTLTGGRIFIMVFGPKYHKKEKHIHVANNLNVPFWTYTTENLRAAAHLLGFLDDEIETMSVNAWGDWLEKILPNKNILGAYMRAETRALLRGRKMAKAGFYQIMVLTKTRRFTSGQ